jgi:hypothetical protein
MQEEEVCSVLCLPVWSFHLTFICINTNIVVINFSSMDIQSITFFKMSTDPKNRGIYQHPAI